MSQAAIEYMAELLRAPDRETKAKEHLQRYASLMFAPVDEPITVRDLVEFIAATKIFGEKTAALLERRVEVDELGNRTLRVDLSELARLKEG